MDDRDSDASDMSQTNDPLTETACIPIRIRCAARKRPVCKPLGFNTHMTSLDPQCRNETQP